jgi:predicted ribosomally synthesized peptide with nif11-like leader
MSIESAKNFLEKMQNDAAFAEQVKKAKNLDESSKIITAAGFNFTEAELANAQQGELKDEELEAVAGGVYLCTVDACGKD